MARLQKKKIKKKKPQRKKITPWQPIKMEMIQISDPFPESLSKKERVGIIKRIGQKAEQDFNKKYSEINTWFEKYDPIYILSFCLVYFLSYPEGTDPEAEGSQDFYPYYIEIMQALCLYKPRNYLPNPLLKKDVDKLQKAMKEFGSLLQLKMLNIPKEITADKDLSAHHLRMEMMSHTMAIRNWAYPEQMKKILFDLFEKVVPEFKKLYGLNPIKIAEVFFKLLDIFHNRLNEHLEKTRSFFNCKSYREMIRAYNEAFPDNIQITNDQSQEMWELSNKNLNNLRGMLVSHSDLRLSSIATFTLEDIVSAYGDNNKKEKIKSFFDNLSHKFEELKEYPLEHIMLSNPVHNKPFIILEDDSYYSSVLVTIQHFIFEIFESLLFEDNEIKKKYNDKIKPQYLEDRTEELFIKHFKNAQVYRGSQWQCPKEKKLYENDVLVLIDTFAIVIEAKSAKITPPALRGAPKRLAETLKGLIEAPSEQAIRFVDFLKSNPSNHSFTTKNGKINKIDSSQIKYFIPLGVTLAQLGSISSNLKKMIDSGITNKNIRELSPSISLTDLEIIFELLPLEAEKIHYLARRKEIEYHLNYEGDEMDLIAFYVDTGFNIGETEFDGNNMLNLTMKSKELDPYFVGKESGILLKKPTVKRTKLWQDLLNRLVEKKPKNWLETSFILLNATEDDQIKFEEKFKELMQMVISNKAPHKYNWVNFESGPPDRRYLISGFPYFEDDKEKRNNIMANILFDPEVKNMRGSLVIGVNLKQGHYPYSVLSGRVDTNLFEI